MSDAEKLKNILKEKNMSVKKLAVCADIPPTTLYSIIKRNSSIRLDTANRISEVLGIQPDEICSADVEKQKMVNTENCVSKKEMMNSFFQINYCPFCGRKM